MITRLKDLLFLSFRLCGCRNAPRNPFTANFLSIKKDFPLFSRWLFSPLFSLVFGKLWIKTRNCLIDMNIVCPTQRRKRQFGDATMPIRWSSLSAECTGSRMSPRMLSTLGRKGLAPDDAPSRWLHLPPPPLWCQSSSPGGPVSSGLRSSRHHR